MAAAAALNGQDIWAEVKTEHQIFFFGSDTNLTEDFDNFVNDP